DPDNDPLTFSSVVGPAAMSVDPATGQVTWSPTSADLGTHDVTLRVDDGRGGFDTQNFAIDVLTDRPLEIGRIHDKTVEVGVTLQFSLGNPGLKAGDLLVGNVTLPVAQVKSIDPTTGMQSLVFELTSHPAGGEEGEKPNFRPNSL